MKTEEVIEESEVEWAIKYLKTVKHDQWVESHYINEAVPIIITLLQQGEKYKLVVNEIKLGMPIGQYWSDYIENIEQKYFPKETKL